MTAVVGVLFLHLLLISKGYNAQIQAIPGLLLLVNFYDHLRIDLLTLWIGLDKHVCIRVQSQLLDNE